MGHRCAHVSCTTFAIRAGLTSLVVTGLTLIMWFCSNIRDFSSMTALGLVAAFTMFVATLLVLIGHGVQGASRLSLSLGTRCSG